MRRLVAILNPQADRGRTASLAQSLRGALSGRLELQLLETTKRGEAIDLARKAAETGCDCVLAIGGDGTVHEVMNGLMQLSADRRPALAIVPAGSGNDVAYALGIEKDLSRSAELIRQGVTRTVDVGEIRTSIGKRCFCLNNVGLLLEGEINWASHQLHWPRGSGLYIRAMLQTLMRRLPTVQLRLTVDGRQFDRRATILSLANGPRSGGKFQLMPDATLDDGRFDYLLAPPVGRLKLLWNVRHALAGKRLNGAWIERGRFSQMTIRADRPLVSHVDGEPWLAASEGVHELSVTVQPSALRVICPAPPAAVP
ncbi:MAG TPA: diacylglycerol kinase family protein [Lacipirellula sp.]